MHIYGPTQLHGAQPIAAPHGNRAPQRTTRSDSATPINDEVQISDAARLSEQISEIPEIRQDRVNDIRARIAAGTYETDEKIEGAVERLLDEIG